MKDSKEEQSDPLTDISETSSEFHEVDVSIDEEKEEFETKPENSISTESPPNEQGSPETKSEIEIPEEWKGKPEEEIKLLLENQDLKKQLEASEKNWFDKYARLQAEFDNFRKRSLKERENYIKYAASQLIKKLLPVLDGADSMLKTLESKLNANEIQGIQMFITELFKVLEKEGLSPIKAKGEKFDPFLHEILTMEYTDEYPEETILEVFQKGYKFKDRVLRPSRVKISKPLPKEKPKEAQPEKAEPKGIESDEAEPKKAESDQGKEDVENKKPKDN
ncbi:MAG: nucleotide exchange factor GrpE [Candidatus Helarchaeota archaeon]